jgi:hypothetical protein
MSCVKHSVCVCWGGSGEGGGGVWVGGLQRGLCQVSQQTTARLQGVESLAWLAPELKGKAMGIIGTRSICVEACRIFKGKGVVEQVARLWRQCFVGCPPLAGRAQPPFFWVTRGATSRLGPC